MKFYLRAWREEPVLMWRLWKSRWFPHRMATLNVDKLAADLATSNVHVIGAYLGPWEWHPPRRGPLRLLFRLHHRA